MKITLPKLFKSSHNPTTNPQSLFNTEKSHAQVLKSGLFAVDSFLVPSYLQCGSLRSAFKLFDEIPNWKLSSVNSIISSLVVFKYHEEVFFLFSRLCCLAISPDEFTFCKVLSAATSIRDLNLGKQLQANMNKTGFSGDVFAGSSLLDLHSKLGFVDDCVKVFDDIHKPNIVSYTTLIAGLLKNGRLNDAYSLFHRMPERNVVSWNSMIAGCSRIGCNEEAVGLFVGMQREGLYPTQLSFPSVLTAASNIASLGLGRSIHAVSIKFLPNPNVYITSSLISFYAKCGCLEDSDLVFDRHKEKGDVVPWNALICGYAQNGRGTEALELYRKMQSFGVKPNDVSLLGLIFGCNHAGLVDEGYSCFNQARLENSDMLRPVHYACVVNLFSRSGRYAEAEKFVSELPFDPGIGFWKALLVGCQINSHKELADCVAGRIETLDPNDVSSYVLLSNVYAAAGSWQKTSVIRQEMKDRKIDLIPGCSWIEIGNKLHVFYNRDQRHAQTSDIYRVLSWFYDQL